MFSFEQSKLDLDLGYVANDQVSLEDNVAVLQMK
jgi:hypothetical protein